MRVLDVDRAGLHAREQGLGSAEARAYGRALCRRCTGTPLQHLTGEQGFRHLVLDGATRRVRPAARDGGPRGRRARAPGRHRDAVRGRSSAPGSGAVALAIADERPGTRVIGDGPFRGRRGPRARERRAARARGGRPRRRPVRAGAGGVPGRVDLVVANPPYLSVETADDLPPEVRADPPEALFGGLELTRRLITESRRLAPAGWRVGGRDATRAPRRRSPPRLAMPASRGCSCGAT